MEHNLFKPNSLEDGKHAVVGDCNGFTMQQRWDAETPAFAKAILSIWFASKKGTAVYNSLNANDGIPRILDYGCGVGRLAKEICNQNQHTFVTGVDASKDMMKQAEIYVNSTRFSTKSPEELTEKFDIAYCVYVLQHCPAIEIRNVLERIWSTLKDDGVFVYCSSDYRMCIRFDGGGFFDDRFLGVDLQEEIDRYFEKVGPLFGEEDFKDNPILRKMITGFDGGLPHPAFVYKKRKENPLFTVRYDKNKVEDAVIVEPTVTEEEIKKLVLVNRLAPGDILVMTNALRDLHKAHPGRYITDVRTPCNEIFSNSPYITKIEYDESKYNEAYNKFVGGKDKLIVGDVMFIDMQYPMIHRSGQLGAHFSEGHREYLETVLGIKIPQTEITPEIYLTQDEKSWVSPVAVKTGYSGKYWLINAGSKGDFTLKQYPFYQEVVDLLKDKIKFIQIGQGAHNHIPLSGALSIIDKTNLRELFRAAYFAEGILTCVSLPMHVAAAFKKPCVVVAGAREGTRWELYPNHQFLYVNGCLPCATYDGCWKSKLNECSNIAATGNPKCMELIKPQDVARSIERYYEGGMLTK